MQISQQELIKSIINGVGALIDARIKPLETNLRAEIRLSEKRLTQRIDSVENRVEKIEYRLVKVEDRLTNVEDKLDKSLYENSERFVALEESVGISSPKH